MINSKVYRKYYQNKSYISEVFSLHKKRLVIMILMAIFCAVLAISSIIQKREQLDFCNLLDRNLFCFLSGEISGYSLFFKHLIGYIFITLIIFTTCYFKPCLIASYILILYSFFKLIFNFSLLICLCGIKGLLCYLASFILNLSILIILFFLVLVSIEQLQSCKKHGSNGGTLKYFLLALLVILILLALDTIVIKIISPILIIII